VERLSELKFQTTICMISNPSYSYIIVEDALDVCAGLKERMNSFSKWNFCGIAHDIRTAQTLLESVSPTLIFMDWDIQGGSTFELLDWIKEQPNYQPYIIFFTAFQGDEPSIPVEIHNSYHVDKYLIKPFWSQLSNQLDNFIYQAEIKANLTPFHAFRTEDKRLVRINLNDIVYVAVFESDKRTKSIYLKSKETLIVKIKLEVVESLLNKAGISTFRPNRKFSIVNIQYILSYKRPVIYLNHTHHTLEVSNDLLAEFELLLKNKLL
jgi:two-component system LytT family response regulator